MLSGTPCVQWLRLTIPMLFSFSDQTTYMYVFTSFVLVSSAVHAISFASRPHNPCATTRALPNAWLARDHSHRTSRVQYGRFPCFSRIGRSETRQRPPGGTRRTGGAVRSKDLPAGKLSSTASDVAFDDEEPLSFEDFEKALRLNAPDEDGGGSESAATTGINWQLLFRDVLAQPIFFGVFYLLATPAIRESMELMRSVFEIHVLFLIHHRPL